MSKLPIRSWRAARLSSRLVHLRSRESTDGHVMSWIMKMTIGGRLRTFVLRTEKRTLSHLRTASYRSPQGRSCCCSLEPCFESPKGSLCTALSTVAGQPVTIKPCDARTSEGDLAYDLPSVRSGAGRKDGQDRTLGAAAAEFRGLRFITSPSAR